MSSHEKSPPLNAARIAFVCLCTLLGISLAAGNNFSIAWIGAIGGLTFGGLIVALDSGLKHFTIRGFSHGTLGLLIGVLCAWLITRIGIFENGWIERYPLASDIFQLGTYLALGFIGMMLALRSHRDEFSLIIPYMKFRQESEQGSLLLLDTDAIIDGRIPKLCETGFLTGKLLVPQFVLDHLQRLADDPEDAIASQRGKRGLNGLQKLQSTDGIDVMIHGEEPTAETNHGKLIQLAKRIGARIVTTDQNLTSVARLQNINVLNLHELATGMRPRVAPGDELELQLVKEGKDGHQAIGFLPDGTMIVVNQAIARIGTTQWVVVAGTTQTSAGRLIFAELRDGRS